MSETIGYPNSYQLEQVLSEFCKHTIVESFALKRGIVLTNASQAKMAEYLSDCLFNHEELEEIRDAAFGSTGIGTLAGLVVTAQDGELELIDFLDQKRNSVVDEKKQMFLGSQYLDGNGSGAALYGDVTYIQYVPGRIEFLQGAQRSFSYAVRRVGEGRWELLVDCGRSNDARIMEDWLRRELRRDCDVACEVDVIDEENLNSKKTVQFFDDLALDALGSAWSFRQVTRLVLRSPTAQDQAEGDETEVEGASLGGITRAILEGESLRNSPFVKDCESAGYRFAAMTCEYEHKEHALVARVRAEFKRRPKVFEVALESYKRRRGVDSELVDETPDGSERHRLLAAFWARARAVYDGMQ